MTAQPPGDPWRGQHPVPPSRDATTELPAVPGGRSWWSRLDPAPRVFLIVGAVALPLLLFCGGLAVLVAIGGDDPAEQAAPGPSTSATGQRATATAAPTSRGPTVVTRTVTETEEIPFEETTVEDSSVPEGTREVRTEGTAGKRAITYEVTFTDGVETGKRRVGTEVTREPVDRVVVVGTKPAEPDPPEEEEEESDCHPSYADVCVPFASDVDCAGGSGDGPAYVRGPVRVVGPDVYDLDRDGDGVACEPR
ncbi:MAG: G5 domain-containing protein [Natronosporangium sp.]